MLGGFHFSVWVLLAMTGFYENFSGSNLPQKEGRRDNWHLLLVHSDFVTLRSAADTPLWV